MSLKHKLDYCVKQVETIEQLNRKVDQLKNGSLASLEELHQLLVKNKEFADSQDWRTQTMLTHLESIIEILNKQI